MKYLVSFFCVAFLLHLVACHPPGRKLLNMEVLQGDVVILATMFDVSDRSTVSEIWDAAGEKPFSTEVVAPTLVASKESPLKTELSGPVEIRILHTTSLETSVTLTGLILVRTTSESEDWHLPVSEVRRAKKGAL
ncbi:MAG: hypothetical protein CMJ86_02435 [Planctomycetes bacterium]|nr:hypothetical protein [Planctomycetota bacterium]